MKPIVMDKGFAELGCQDIPAWKLIGKDKMIEIKKSKFGYSHKGNQVNAHCQTDGVTFQGADFQTISPFY